MEEMGKIISLSERRDKGVDRGRRLDLPVSLEIQPAGTRDRVSGVELQRIRVEFLEFLGKNRGRILELKGGIQRSVLENSVLFSQTGSTRDLWESIRDEDTEGVTQNKPEQYMAIVIVLAKKLFSDREKPSYYKELVTI